MQDILLRGKVARRRHKIYLRKIAASKHTASTLPTKWYIHSKYIQYREFAWLCKTQLQWNFTMMVTCWSAKLKGQFKTKLNNVLYFPTDGYHTIFFLLLAHVHNFRYSYMQNTLCEVTRPSILVFSSKKPGMMRNLAYFTAQPETLKHTTHNC